MSIAPSNIIALAASTAVNFTMNRSLAFKSSANPTRSLVLYLVLFAFNTTFSTLAITWLVSLGRTPRRQAHDHGVHCHVELRAVSQGHFQENPSKGEA